MKVKVYSKPNCMQCDFTKRFLNENGIEFEYIDVTKDTEALEHVKSLGFQSLPVVEADGREPFYGFRPDRLEELAE